MINDFILLRFCRPAYGRHRRRRSFGEKLHRLAVAQIRYWYPQATVHVLTDHEGPPARNVVYHVDPSLPQDGLAFFRIYSLLDRPAMYLDTDVALLRPFSAAQLETPYNFRLFSIDGTIRHLRRYNTGVIWVPRPDPRITKELWKIYRQWPLSRRIGTCGEFAVTHFVRRHKWRMPLRSGVNVLYRRGMRWRNVQSVHLFRNHKHRAFLPLLKSRGRLAYPLHG